MRICRAWRTASLARGFMTPTTLFELSLEEQTYYNANVQLWEHLKERIIRAGAARKALRDAITDEKSRQAYADELRSHFIARIGGMPRAEGQPVVRQCGETVEKNLTIQNLILETRPGVLATANLYLPSGLAAAGNPALLFLCGHTPHGKTEPRYQTICRILASRGFIVLSLDPTGQGERSNYYDKSTGAPSIRPATGDHDYAGLQCLLQGHNLTRYMLHDAIRAVDFLSVHPLVDAARIGITGNSGGGTQTCLMLLVEPRIAAAAPSSFLTSRRAIFDSGYAQDAEQIWRGFSGAGYEHADLLLSFAPKPLCILSPQYDFFPVEGTLATLAEARRFWEMSGHGENLRHAKDRATHGYTDNLGRAAADFFATHLGPVAAMEVDRTPVSSEALWATKSGYVSADYPESRTIFDENVAAFEASGKGRGGMLEFLRAAVFKDREPVDVNLRITKEASLGGMTASVGFWWSQRGLINSGILLRPTDSRAKKLPVTIAVWEDGIRRLSEHAGWIRRETGEGRAVLVLNVTGAGPLEPNLFQQKTSLKGHYGTFFRISDDLITLDDSFAALRAYDVLRSLDTLGHWGGLDEEDVRLYLRGRHGIYGALAAPLDKRIAQVTWDDPMPKHSELLRTRFYDEYDIKSLVVPGLAVVEEG